MAATQISNSIAPNNAEIPDQNKIEEEDLLILGLNLRSLRHLTELDLSFNNLTSVPDEFSELHLSKINLSNNNLKEVPHFLYVKQYRIVELDLSFNSITECLVPNCLLSLSKFYINNNLLAQMPSWIWESSGRLTELNISCNPIEMQKYGLMYKTFWSTSRLRTLSITNCNMNDFFVFVLEYIPNLHYLSIGNNPEFKFSNLWDLPIASLHCKNNLRELHAINLNLASVPNNVADLVALRVLDLSDNELYWLPYTIGDLKNLRKCFLSHNKIIYLPESFANLFALEELHLDGNLITHISFDFSKLMRLTYLDLYDNCLEEIDPGMFNDVKLLDLEQNYAADESSEYVEKKLKLRGGLNENCERIDGCKIKPIELTDILDSSGECDDKNSKCEEEFFEQVEVSDEGMKITIDSPENWDNTDDNDYEPVVLYQNNGCASSPCNTVTSQPHFNFEEIFQDAD